MWPARAVRPLPRPRPESPQTKPSTAATQTGKQPVTHCKPRCNADAFRAHAAADMYVCEVMGEGWSFAFILIPICNCSAPVSAACSSAVCSCSNPYHHQAQHMHSLLPGLILPPPEVSLFARGGSNSTTSSNTLASLGAASGTTAAIAAIAAAAGHAGRQHRVHCRPLLAACILAATGCCCCCCSTPTTGAPATVTVSMMSMYECGRGCE